MARGSPCPSGERCRLGRAELYRERTEPGNAVSGRGKKGNPEEMNHRGTETQRRDYFLSSLCLCASVVQMRGKAIREGCIVPGSSAGVSSMPTCSPVTTVPNSV